jgi:hypothetical protein
LRDALTSGGASSRLHHLVRYGTSVDDGAHSKCGFGPKTIWVVQRHQFRRVPERDTICCVSDYWGRSTATLGRRLPLVALALALSLLALAGIPPMGSFVGKAMLFGAAMGAGMTWLAVVAAANSALSLYYYARVLEVSYLRAPVTGGKLRSTNIRWTVGAVLAASLAILLLGVFPAPLVVLATHASTMLHTVAAAGP